MQSMFGCAYVCESRPHFLPWSKSNLKTQIEWQSKHWTTVSDLLPPSLTGIDKGSRVLEKAQPLASHWKRFVVNSYVPLCNNFNGALILPFSFKYFESVVLYIILLEVARESSRFCEMAWRSKVVGPRWIKLLSSIKTIVVNISLRTRTEEEWKFHMGGMKSSKINKGRNASKKVGNRCLNRSTLILVCRLAINNLKIFRIYSIVSRGL